MINKTRLIFVTITALCLLPELVFGDGKVSLRLQGGWAYLSAGDINPGTQAFFDYISRPVLEGGYRALHNGSEVGGDIIFDLTPRLGIGIGISSMLSSRTSRMNLGVDPEDDNIGGDVISGPKLSTMPIRLGFYLTVPLGKKFNLHADAGASCYFESRYNDEWSMHFSNFNIDVETIQISTRAEKKGAPIGFQGGIGLEYKLRHNIFLYIDAAGRYVRFRGWEGSSELWIHELTGDSSFHEHGILYYETVPMLTLSPRLIIVQSAPPDGPGGEPRQAVVDFSGVSLQFGIRIRL